MNFAGPFVSEPSHVSPVSLGGDGFTFNKPGFIQHNPSDSHVVIPDAHLLFSGDYTRIGSDLIISGDGQKLVVGNYFKGETRPALTSKDGATLAGHVVDALTGHVHYAQANAAAPAAGQVIGNVLKLSGSASAIRNGVSIELHIGDAIQKGDVIQTGSDSSIGMTFVDGSAFGMTSNARMVMNEMIYDPNGSSNSSLISLVQGTITFVAGQTAKNGNMRVETPVATMGIRGTAVLVEIGANDGPTKFSVLVEPDGHTGSYNLYDKATGQLIGTVSQAGQVTFVTSLGLGQPPSAIEQLKTLQDQQNEKAIIQQVFQLYFPNYNPDDSNPKSPKFGHNTSGNNLAEIIFTTNSNAQQTFLTQIELRFAVTDPITGITTYQNKIFYNAKASFSADSVFGNQAFVPTTESFKFADVVKIDDPDIGNAPFYDIGVPFVAGSAIIKSAVSTIPQMSEAFLKSLLSINQTTGLVSFDRQQFNFLDDGQTVTFKIQVTATSGPDTGLVEIPVTITGENDAPTIVVGAATTVTGDVKEDVAITSGHIGTNGKITFQDFDLTDAHAATVDLTSTASSLPHFVAGTEIGHFTIDPVAENLTDTNNHGTVGWHFTLNDNDPTLQSLAEGQTITQTYTITITDNNGIPVTQTVTITITGTNDAPMLAADTSVHQADEVVNTTNSSVEDVVNGSLSFTDVDLSDTHTATAALHPGTSSVVWSGGAYSGIPSATLAALGTAMKTTVNDSTDTGAGSVGWEFKLPDHLFDFLADGETLTLTYDVTITDNNGVSSTQQVTVQVGAANDQPVISVIDNSSTLQEDVGVQPGNLLTDSGSVTFTDTDLTDTHTAHVIFNNAVGGNGGSVNTALLTALGTALSVPSSALATGVHTFGWDFALNNSLVQYLGAGETVTATYTITVGDSSGDSNDTSIGQTVTVVLTGTNDTPVITAVDVSGAVTEDTALEPGNVLHDTGSVTFADADATDHETASVAFVGDTTTSAAAIPGALHTALQNALTLQNDSFTSNTGTITWDFNLDNSLVQ
ncbi:VCBS domain-containing protein, partial [Afipia clevelandensis]